MVSRIFNLWQITKNSLWFMPALICFAYFCATVFTYVFEIVYLQEYEFPSWLYNGTTDDAKHVFSTLMPAMITMATLVISITIVVISLAASQLGPRLIKSFMGDEKTQTFIGLFLGAVIACFVLIRILHDETLTQQTPALTISLVFAICFTNLFVLLAFVHHVAESSIANNVVNRVGSRLMSTISRLADNDEEDNENDVEDSSTKKLPKDFSQKSKSLDFPRSGYIQSIDYLGLLETAQDHDLVIEIGFSAGHFLIHGEKTVSVYPKNKLNENLEKKLVNDFIIGNVRTPTQDIAYSVRHLVEIALRALSPGINDNFTAIAVLDKLSASLAHLFGKRIPLRNYEDENGKLRIKGGYEGQKDLIMDAFSQIRDAAQNKYDVTLHLLNRIKVLASLERSKDYKEALKKQLTYIEENIDKNFGDTQEGKDLTAAVQDTKKAF